MLAFEAVGGGGVGGGEGNILAGAGGESGSGEGITGAGSKGGGLGYGAGVVDDEFGGSRL